MNISWRVAYPLHSKHVPSAFRFPPFAQKGGSGNVHTAERQDSHSYQQHRSTPSTRLGRRLQKARMGVLCPVWEVEIGSCKLRYPAWRSVQKPPPLRLAQGRRCRCATRTGHPTSKSRFLPLVGMTSLLG
jgi:hypothetical protein